MPHSLDELIARADEFAEKFEDYEPHPEDESRITPLTVRMAAYKRAAAERELAETIRGARDAGISWREIGDAVGTSGEAARQRYGS